jgi:hypothetical protein
MLRELYDAQMSAVFSDAIPGDKMRVHLITAPGLFVTWVFCKIVQMEETLITVTNDLKALCSLMVDGQCNISLTTIPT